MKKKPKLDKNIFHLSKLNRYELVLASFSSRRMSNDLSAASRPAPEERWAGDANVPATCHSELRATFIHLRSRQRAWETPTMMLSFFSLNKLTSPLKWNVVKTRYYPMWSDLVKLELQALYFSERELKTFPRSFDGLGATDFFPSASGSQRRIPGTGQKTHQLHINL